VTCFRAIPAILTLVLANQACAGHHLDLTTVPSLSVVEGRVGFEVLADPNSPKPTLSPEQKFTPPFALARPLPEYPKEALVAGASEAILLVRIIVEEDGTVREVAPSPLGPTAESGHRGPFWSAIEQAVRNWRFLPASIDTFEGHDRDGNGTADYYDQVEARPVRAYLDLRFKFEIVNGQGRVQLGQSP